MSRIGNIIYPIPPKEYLCNILMLCVGEILINQWKQGNTEFIKSLKDLFNQRSFYFDK